MKISIIGTGNIGTLMAAELSRKGNDVTIYSRNPEKWSSKIKVYDENGHFLFESPKIKIAKSLEEAVCNMDMIWITSLAYTFSWYAKKLESLLKSDQILCIAPGSGGAEFAFSKIIKNGVILLGLQRVHSIARLIEYRNSVSMLGRKSQIYYDTIPSSKASQYGNMISSLVSMHSTSLPNYLNVTLTPSNPILYTSRLYSMFKDKPVNYEYASAPLFYEDWDIETSKIMFKCDEELSELCKKIPLELSGVIPLRRHYESNIGNCKNF